MKLSSKPLINGSTPFNENFDCNKMKLLVAGECKESFSEKFKKWLQAYTKTAKEKIWLDIESYHTG
jgi:hypothetical protein